MSTLFAALLAPTLAGATVVRPVGGARDGWDRPTLSGPEIEIASPDGAFVVHYTLEGADRPAGGDADGDGVPDTVERTIEALCLGRESYEREGWRPLIGDGGLDGSDAIDLYLQEVDINGYAHGVPVSGEEGRGSCWVEVDGSLGGTGGRVLESVVVHELHHCVQYRYTWDAHSWVHEATATYEQYRVLIDPGLQLALTLLWSARLDEPWRAVDDLEGRYEYAAFVFLKFWVEYRGSDIARAVRMWEALARDPEWRTALDDAARAEWGITIEEAFQVYASWNGFACARDDGAHYDPDVLPCGIGDALPEVPVDALSADGSPFAIAHEAVPFTASYAEFPADGSDRPVAVECGGPGPGAAAGMQLVALDGAGRAGEVAPAWASGEEPLAARLLEPLDPEGSVLLVATSTGAEPIDCACTARRVEPEAGVCASGGCVTLPGRAAPAAAILALLALSFGRRRRVGCGS